MKTPVVNVLTLAALALVATGCGRTNMGSANGPTAGGAGMANTTSPPVASTPPPAPPPAPPPPVVSDAGRDFATRAAQGGLFEVDAAKLAEDKAMNAKVKEFAARMVTDHTSADNQLASIAQNDQISLPTSLNSADQAQLDHLQKLKGRAFDRAYSRMMLQDHQQDVQDFQQAANAIQDADLKSFAQSTLPVLQAHLALAQALPGAKGRRQASAQSQSSNR